LEVFIITASLQKESKLNQIFNSIQRYPARMSKDIFYPLAYSYMYLSRKMDERFKELFKKGHVKGTVITCFGNEATTVGMALPFRPKKDVISILHRDLGAHLLTGSTLLTLICQYMANENSPTKGREGNVHHGDAAHRKLPMISHLGSMLAPAVGAVWAARQNDSDVFGLSTIGDGGTSTGDFHESINLASVQKVPVLFVIENNALAYSTPVKYQYNCEKLSDKAIGYGIQGKTIDGTDVWEVYNAVCDSLDSMSSTSLPYLIESDTLRLEGHAVYDNAEYVSAEELSAWKLRDPVPKARKQLEQYGFTEPDIVGLENEITSYIDENIKVALEFGRPDPAKVSLEVFAPSKLENIEPLSSPNKRNQTAINAALEYILTKNPEAFICGQDIGIYGSPFKTCKDLIQKFGKSRVIDMPICESATVGFCLGASQTGARPIMEFQFADFGTEAVSQLGLNVGTWFYRAEKAAPTLFRLPCGGGIGLGAFHSGEFDGLWSRFPGLKLLYPVTPQESFEAILYGFYDPNPCIVFEHKQLYWGKQGNIEFDGNLSAIARPRQYSSGDDITIISFGSMAETTLSAITKFNYSAELWNPFILNPLNMEPIINSVKKTGRLLVVQESGETAGLGDRIISIITRNCFAYLKTAPMLISAPDIPVPFAKELEQFYLPNQERICGVIESMIGANK
jgi:2-oxoisovalerate dehydrogenase E1 component